MDTHGYCTICGCSHNDHENSDIIYQLETKPLVTEISALKEQFGEASKDLDNT
jgi:hypothetical protein